MTSLDEDKNHFQVLFETNAADVDNRAVLEFLKSPHKLRVGTHRVEFPYSPAHLMRNCQFWKLATEGGDAPAHILTEHSIPADNIKFQRAWLIVNGLMDVTPTELQNNMYLDYLLFRKKHGVANMSYIGEIKVLRETISLRRKLQEEKEEELRRKIAADAQAADQAAAVKIMKDFLVQTEKRMEIDVIPSRGTKDILRDNGFTVNPFPSVGFDGKKRTYVYLATQKRKAEAVVAQPAKKSKTK
jgi:hypothetical protein